MDSVELVGVGDDPALAFVNSVAAPNRKPMELIADGASYADFLEQAGLIDADDRAAVADRFSAPALDVVAAEAARLREWLRPVIAEWAATGRVPAAAADRLSEILALERRFEVAAADPAAGGLTVRTRHAWQDPQELLVPPIAAAAHLLATGTREYVRRCESPNCTLWFYDRTKSHRRRWCSMAVCGNREKARALRERRAAAE